MHCNADSGRSLLTMGVTPGNSFAPRMLPQRDGLPRLESGSLPANGPWKSALVFSAWRSLSGGIWWPLPRTCSQLTAEHCFLNGHHQQEKGGSGVGRTKEAISCPLAARYLRVVYSQSDTSENID